MHEETGLQSQDGRSVNLGFLSLCMQRDHNA